MSNSEALLTTAEVAEALQVHPKTVNRWVRDGLLEAERVGPRLLRFRQDALDAFLAGTSGDAA